MWKSVRGRRRVDGVFHTGEEAVPDATKLGDAGFDAYVTIDATARGALASFFDMRATWTKWVDDMLFMQSMLAPAGTMFGIVPCLFHGGGGCRGGARSRFVNLGMVLAHVMLPGSRHGCPE